MIILPFTHKESVNIMAHSWFFPIINVYPIKESIFPAVYKNLTENRFVKSFVAIKNVCTLTGKTLNLNNADIVGDAADPANRFCHAPGYSHRETVTILKQCMSRLVDSCRKVKNIIVHRFYSLSSQRSFMDFQKKQSPTKKSCDKFTGSAEAYYARLIDKKIRDTLVNHNNTHGGTNEAWESQESRTYIGAVINKTIDKFITTDEGKRITQTLGISESRKIWSNEIYKKLNYKDGSGRENDIHKLANPSIYKAVFEFFADPSNEIADPLIGNGVKKLCNDAEFIWKICHRVFVAKFKYVPSPEKVIAQTLNYLDKLQPARPPEPEISSPSEGKHAKAYTSGATFLSKNFMNFLMGMIDKTVA